VKFNIMNEVYTDLEDHKSTLTLDEYQERTRDTWIGEHKVERAFLGLAGEVGELCELRKKWLRDGKVDPHEWYQGEIGDVLYYLARIADENGLCLGEIASYNLLKLKSRKERGVIQGSGDNR